jgi:hypothetical protein
MRDRLHSHSRATLRRAGKIALLAGFMVTAVPAAWADEGGALRILKTMADHVSSQPTLFLKYDSDMEVVTQALEKIQFSASGEATLSRPDKFRISRTGGYADIELVSDGKNLTLTDKDHKRFAQIPASGSFDQVVDKLRAELMIEIPGADLLLSKPYDELAAGVLEAKHVGRGVVEGVECEHLAFRNADTDWQLWVEAGERPVPRKYVITSKTVAGAPQYTLRIRDWKTGISLAPEAFSYAPPADYSGVAVTALTDIDEVPTGALPGGTK